MELHLDEKEASLLFRVTRNRLNELKDEVRHDKNSETREYLKHKVRILQRILEKFPPLDEKAHMEGFFMDR